MSQPKYVIFMNQVRNGILSGKYMPGEKLPSENEFTATLGISRQTVRQGLALLENEGWVEKRHGSGTIVLAGALNRPRTGAIAVITTYIGEYIFPDMLRGIEQALGKHGASPLLSATHNRIDNERRILKELADKKVDGLIVEGTKTALPNPNISIYRNMIAEGLPIVFVHGFYPELRDVPHVVADDMAGGRQAATYLYNKGKRKICGIFKNDDVQGLSRYAGFIQILHENQMEISDDCILWYNTETRKKIISDGLLALVQGCDALVCYNDEVALQAVEILIKAGIEIPRQISIVSFDNSSYSSLAPVKITSFAGNEFKIGQLAAEKLMNMLDGKKETSEVLPWTLIEKESS